MKIRVKVPKQYRGSYQTLVFSDVVEMRQSKDGKYTTLIFADRGKTKRLTRLIEVLK